MRFLLLGLLIVIFSACLDEPDCVDSSSNLIKIDLKKAAVDEADTIAFSKIEVSGTDSLFHVKDTVAVLSLPLNPGTNETTFNFYYDSKVETMVVSYTWQTRLASPKCGAFTYFYDLAVVSSSFGEVSVTNSQVFKNGSTNLTVKL